MYVMSGCTQARMVACTHVCDVCMCARNLKHASAHAGMYVCMCVGGELCMQCMYVCIHVFMHACMYVMHLCGYGYICVCT